MPASDHTFNCCLKCFLCNSVHTSLVSASHFHCQTRGPQLKQHKHSSTRTEAQQGPTGFLCFCFMHLLHSGSAVSVNVSHDIKVIWFDSAPVLWVSNFTTTIALILPIAVKNMNKEQNFTKLYIIYIISISSHFERHVIHF